MCFWSKCAEEEEQKETKELFKPRPKCAADVETLSPESLLELFSKLLIHYKVATAVVFQLEAPLSLPVLVFRDKSSSWWLCPGRDMSWEWRDVFLKGRLSGGEEGLR